MHYLVVILQILQQAASVNVDDASDEDLVEYINTLRESILGAYTGILQVWKRDSIFIDVLILIELGCRA